MAVYGIKSGVGAPDTFVRTSHALTIMINSQKIGLINGWNPAMTRQVTPIYELNAETSGLPYENIPGNVQGLTVAIQRYDVWTQKMEQVLGGADLTMLSQQGSPFSVQETWLSPTGNTEAYEYTGCWFNSLGRTIRSDDTRIINVSASLIYLHKKKIQSL